MADNFDLITGGQSARKQGRSTDIGSEIHVPHVVLAGVDGVAATRTNVGTKGSAFEIASSPTVTAGAYTAGDVLGVKMSLAAAARASGDGGILVGIALFDEGANGLANTIDVFIFRDDPTGSTFTDNAALAIVDADGPKLVDVVTLDEIFDTGDGKFLRARGLNIPYVCATTLLYAVAVHRGTWAPDATDGLTFGFQMLRD